MPLAPDMPLLDDARSAADQMSVGALMREINLRARPGWVLRMLMGALDRKRQALGLGWSRPWNKSGMNIFGAHRFRPAEDRLVLEAPMQAIRQYAPEPLLSLAFIEDLFADPALMAFAFYHNRESGGAHYEGLTLSFGRHVPEDRTKRDRLDLILEDRRVDGRVDGCVDLVRIMVCPWSTYGIDRDHQRYEQCDFSAEERCCFQRVYSDAVGNFHAWRHDESRQWTHWSAAFIDYFGPRAFVPEGSSFG